MSTELVDTSKLLSQEDIEYYNTLAKQNGDVSPKRLPQLKINYEEESKNPRGVWVLGQVKKDGKIVDEGVVVNKMIILNIRNQYNMYVESDITKNCRSPIHKDFVKVIGNNYKNQCGKTCQYKVDGSCKACKVVYVIVITPENEKKEAVMYIRGASYMPLVEYVRDATKVEMEMDGKKIQTSVPLYSIVNLLDSEKDKKGTITYWRAKFTRSQILKRSAVEKLKEQADQLDKDLDRMSTQDDDVPAPNREDEVITPTSVTRENIFEDKKSEPVAKAVIDAPVDDLF